MSKETPRCPVPFTTVPNTIIDEWMYHLSRPAMEALLVIVRDILGWEDRTEAIISFPSFLKRTHQNRTTLTLALQELSQLELIVISDRHAKHGANIYQHGPAIFSSPPAGLVVDHPKVQKKSKTSPVAGPDAVQPVDRMQSSERTGSGPATGLDISRQPTQGEPPHEAKEMSLKKNFKETEKERPAQASPSPGARKLAPSDLSKTEKEENEAPPAPAFSGREQAILQAEGRSKSTDASQGRKEESAPARTAEPETTRQRQREAIDARRQAQEVARKATLAAERIARAAKEAEHRAVGKLQERYDALVLAKQKSEQGSPAWQQAHEELQDVKHQLAAYGWYL